MKLIKTASGKQTIKISKKEWQSIGKIAGWVQAYQVANYGDEGWNSKSWGLNQNASPSVAIPSLSKMVETYDKFINYISYVLANVMNYRTGNEDGTGVINLPHKEDQIGHVVIQYLLEQTEQANEILRDGKIKEFIPYAKEWQSIIDGLSILTDGHIVGDENQTDIEKLSEFHAKLENTKSNTERLINELKNDHENPDANMEEVGDIPGFEGTRENLDKLNI